MALRGHHENARISIEMSVSDHNSVLRAAVDRPSRFASTKSIPFHFDLIDPVRCMLVLTLQCDRDFGCIVQLRISEARDER